ncbi:AI-2E family transporter [bacterium]|nr:AI-2E family transporter [bacterium]
MFENKEGSGRLPNWVLMVVFLVVLGIFVYLIWPLVTPFIAWLLLVILLLPYARRDNRAIVLLGFLTLGVVIYGLMVLWEAFFPVVLSLFFAFFLDPVADRIDIFYNRLAKRERKEPPEDKFGSRMRSLASITVIALAVGLLVGLAFLMVPTITMDIERLSNFDFGALVDKATALADQLANISPEMEEVVGNLTERIQVGLAEAVPDMTTLVKSVFQSLGSLSNLILIPIFTFLLLRDVDRFKKRLIDLVPRRAARFVKNLADDTNNVFIGFFRGKLLTGIFVAVFTGVGMWLIGVPFFLPIALLAGVLNFIPFLGAFVSGAIAVPMALFAPDPLTAMLLTLGLFLVVFTINGYVFDPLIIGKRVGIGATLLLLSVLVGMQFGLIWAFLAVPIAALIKLIALQVERYYKKSFIYLSKGAEKTQ